MLSADWFWTMDAQLRFTSFARHGSEAGQRVELPGNLGRRRWELHGIDADDPCWLEHRRLLEAREPFRDFEFRRLAGGVGRYFRASGEPVFGADGAFLGYVGVTRDVTREHADADRLQAAQALLQMAAQMGRLGGWTWDVGQPRLVWSDEVCAIHDVPSGFAPTPDEALGFVVPEYRAGVRRLLRECSLNGSAFDTEAQCTTARGRRIWVRVICEPQWDAQGKVSRIYGTCQDISEAKHAAERARVLATQLSATLESLTDVFYTLDRQLRFTYVNAVGEQLFGRPREQILGRGLLELFPDLSGGVVEREFMRALRENVTVEFENYYEPFATWFQAKAYPSEQGLAVDLKNITDHHRARQEILRLNAELEERVRRRTAQLEAANRELEAFSYSIAHDVRAPLSTIDGFSQLLERSAGAQLDSRGQHYLQRIRRAVRHMGELTEGLLALSSLSRANLLRERVDLAPMARAALEMCRQQSPARSVQVEIADAMPATGDPRLLAQVMGNLVGNAWKFSACTAHARIEVGLRRESGETVYYVRDNGAGFDMAHSAKMFDAFQRLHGTAEFEGTGIGLAIVHKIVARHGGRVWADAAPGQGACISFTLPENPTAVR